MGARPGCRVRVPTKGLDSWPHHRTSFWSTEPGADGSCWSSVIERLQADGYNVTAPQPPESSLADDVAGVHHVLKRQSGPTVLVAHSYGGQVITALGTDAPNVVGLVYIAGFGLDEGESIGALLQQAPPTPALGVIEVDSKGFAWLPEEGFLAHFAPDIDRSRPRSCAPCSSRCTPPRSTT